MTEEIHGLDIDACSRCIHYRKNEDVVAILMKCCRKYYACIKCHEAMEDHAIIRWSSNEMQFEAVLCGVCGVKQTIQSYVKGASLCIRCSAPFNPLCKEHWHYYFDYE